MSTRILFSGSGAFGLPTLEALRAAGHELVLVVSQPDRPAGRGRQTTPTPIAQYALDNNLPLLRTDNINVEQLPSVDVMVVIAFGQKIASHVTDAPRLGAMNLHASILPKYRGAAPINWTIARGEKYAGNTIIRLAEKMDAGAMLAQSRLEIGELETAGELHDRLSEEGAPLVLKTIDQLISGTAVETPQDHSQATIAPKLSREKTRLDFANSSADDLARLIRGMYPWPGCRLRMLDAAGEEKARFTLVRARKVPCECARFHPGEITTEHTVSVGPGIEALEIIELQPEGKKPMPLPAYRNGHCWIPGMKLESIV